LGGPGRDIVFIDAFTGLRRNEILAFEYTDIDRANKADYPRMPACRTSGSTICGTSSLRC
jgi:hypothetical protein